MTQTKVTVIRSTIFHLTFGDSVYQGRIWDKAFKNGPSETCGRQLSSTNFTWSILEYFVPFRTQSDIYDKVFLRENLTAKSRELFSQKNSTLDVRLGSKYATVYTIGDEEVIHFAWPYGNTQSLWRSTWFYNVVNRLSCEI